MYIADLHTHSHYAQACSKFLTLETLYQWAQIKGIQVISTGDFTHPAWLRELQDKLIPDGNGFFRLKNPPSHAGLSGAKVRALDTRFCLSTEISSVYSYGGKTRKNHNLLYVPDFSSADWINKRLARYGNLAADGRPTISLYSRDLLEVALETPGQQAHLVPAHAWTPWFSTLGSKGGYNSIDECFRDLSQHIFALETGLSSDPAMNWRWSQLDRLTMLSSSDAHSPQKLGREANLFQTEVAYEAMFEAIKTQKGFLGTYELFPEEGKYSWDGHRNCGVCLEPAEAMSLGNICPKCGKQLTVGVMQRVESLSDRKEPLRPEHAASFKHIIPLVEILSELNDAGAESKKVTTAYTEAVNAFGNEFDLLQVADLVDLHQFSPLLAEAISRMRTGKVIRKAGYDGVFGKISLFEGKPALG